VATPKNDWAHTWLRIRAWSRIWDRLRTFTSRSSDTPQDYPELESVLTSDGTLFDTDVDQGEKIGVLAQRALVAQAITSPRSFLDPLMLQLSRAMGYPQTDPLAVLPILYTYMAKNQGAFKSAPKVTQRGFTRGNWTAGGSNVGNGTVLRLAVDQYGLPIESDQPDVLQFLCVKDRNAGTNPGQEQFSVTGLPFRDAIARYNAGVNSIGVGNQVSANNLVGVSCDATQNLIQNPSFASFAGTGATSSFALTGWTQTAGLAASCSIDTTNYYRASNAEATPGALKATASVTFTTTIPAGQLNATLAYMGQLAVNFSQYGGTGSVSLQIGNLGPFTVSSGVGGWNLLRPTIDKNLYYANFVTSGAVTVTLIITVSGGTAILVDDLNFQPFQNVAGKLLWAIGGSTNWVLNDSATITDSVPTTSAVPTTGFTQTMIAEAYGKSLPSFAPATAPTTPTATPTGGGTGASGTYGIVLTFYNGTTLLESAPWERSAPVVLDGTTNDRIAMTAVPTGPAGTTARYFYVTQKNDVALLVGTSFSNPRGPQSAYYYVGQIADNVGTAVTFDPSALDLTKSLSCPGDL
jgi:hypothetical protein